MLLYEPRNPDIHQLFFPSFLGRKKKNGINRPWLLLSNLPQGSASSSPEDKYCNKGRLCYVCKMLVRIFSQFKICVPLPVRVNTTEKLPSEHAPSGRRAVAGCLLTDIFYSRGDGKGRTLPPFRGEARSAGSQSPSVCCRHTLYSLLPE